MFFRRTKRILNSQTSVETDLWDSLFKNYLSDDFEELIGIFEQNRNHVMHNKPIDRQAYSSMKVNIQKLQLILGHGLHKLGRTIVSEEERQRIDEDAAEERSEREAVDREIWESEAGVHVREKRQIEEVLYESFQNYQNDIAEALRFREDLEIDIDSTDSIDVLYKICDSRIVIKAKYSINSDPGSLSECVLNAEGYDDFGLELVYINGEAEFDEEQGDYIPRTQDEEPDVESAVEETVDFINETFRNLRELIDAMEYRIKKDGGDLPVYEDVSCDECGEFYIARDDQFAEKGTCLNCGAMNEVQECVRCGTHFTGYVKDGDVALCDSCNEKIDRE